MWAQIPTFGDNKRDRGVFPLWIITATFTDMKLSVDFVSRLRDEKKFKNIDELKKQVTEDVKRGKEILRRAQCVNHK